MTFDPHEAGRDPDPIWTALGPEDDPRGALGLVRGENGAWYCPRCGAYSGDDWSQCGGACPIKGSPYHKESA